MSKIIKITISFSIIFLTLILDSCTKISPSGFWKNFHSEMIKNKTSDQGPFGGRREIEWKNFNGKLGNKDFVNYANKNGWKLIDSIAIENKTFEKANLKKLDNYALEIIEKEIIPKLSTQKSIIYVFKSGWIRVKPGNETVTEQNGFLISESDKKVFKIIHNWGE